MFLEHKEQKRIANRESQRRRREKNRPLPYVDTICLPVFCRQEILYYELIFDEGTITIEPRPSY